MIETKEITKSLCAINNRITECESKTMQKKLANERDTSYFKHAPQRSIHIRLKGNTTRRMLNKKPTTITYRSILAGNTCITCFGRCVVSVCALAFCVLFVYTFKLKSVCWFCVIVQYSVWIACNTLHRHIERRILMTFFFIQLQCPHSLLR